MKELMDFINAMRDLLLARSDDLDDEKEYYQRKTLKINDKTSNKLPQTKFHSQNNFVPNIMPI